MAFEEITLAKASNGSNFRTGINAGLCKLKGNKALLRFSLYQEVLKKADWVASTRFRVLVGTGDDKGMIRFAPDEKGPGALVMRKTPVARETKYTVSIGHVSSFPDIVAKAEPCQWEVLDRSIIEISLPAWARQRAVATVAASPSGETELQRQNREAAERRKRMGMGK